MTSRSAIHACTWLARRAIWSAALVAGCVLAQTSSLSEAFTQGGALGRTGNASARSHINGTQATKVVPGYTTTPPQTSYFGSTNLIAPASQVAGTCEQAAGTTDATGNGFADQACAAANYSQTNPGRRPSFSIGPNDPLRTGARAITVDPQSIAGSLSGTYSGCSTVTTTSPDRFETALCHEYRVTQANTCDKVRSVQAVFTPGCTDGQFLIRVTADPCRSCEDYLAFDFSCGVNSYRMHVFSINRHTGQLYSELGTQSVPGALNTSIPKTAGPSRMDGDYCYQTFYSQTCSGANCNIGSWFSNPCQGTSYYGVNSFAMPTTVSFVDSWDNQCVSLDALTR